MALWKSTIRRQFALLRAGADASKLSDTVVALGVRPHDVIDRKVANVKNTAYRDRLVGFWRC